MADFAPKPAIPSPAGAPGDAPAPAVPTAVNGGGRDAAGRFTAGNRAAHGNPANRRAQRVRMELLRASTREDIRTICRRLIDGARAGDLAFIREWLDRTAGKPTQQDLLERIESLEQAMQQKGQVKP